MAEHERLVLRMALGFGKRVHRHRAGDGREIGDAQPAVAVLVNQLVRVQRHMHHVPEPVPAEPQFRQPIAQQPPEISRQGGK